MKDELFQYGLVTYDSLLAIYFFIKFNRYQLKDKPRIIVLLPVLLLIAILLDDMFNVIAIIISLLASFSIMYILNFNRVTKLKCFLSCVLYFVTLMLVNSISYTVFYTFADNAIISFSEKISSYFVMCFISKIILLISIKFIIKIFMKIENINKNETILYAMLFVSMFHILVIVLTMFLFMDNRKPDLGLVVTMIMLGIILSELMQYYMYIGISKKTRLEMELELAKRLSSYDKQLDQERKLQAEKLFRVNHDIKNHLLYISYNIQKKEYDKAQRYIDSISNHTGKIKNYVSLTNDTMNFIINQKLESAKDREIDVELQIENIISCPLEEFDLCILLSNILDNAVEALSKMKEKIIKIEIYNQSGYQIYSVKNKLDSSVLKINKRLISSKEDKDNHGYGIKQIYGIADKYHGYIDIYESNNYFCIKAIIPNQSPK